MDIRFREYTFADRQPVLSLFAGNVGPYFPAVESAEFASFLQRVERRELGRYLVALVGEEIVAAGGFARGREERTACLTWGMVARSRHGQGLGRSLLDERITAIRHELPDARVVTIQTSRHTAPFFAKHGFTLGGITPDGFGPGLDIHHMRRAL